MTSDRIRSAAGLTAALVGIQLLMLSLMFRDLEHAASAGLPVTAAAAGAAGWVILTGGTWRIRQSGHRIRRGGAEIWVGFSIAASAPWFGGVVPDRTSGTALVILQAATAAALVWCRRRPAAPDGCDLKPWWAAHALIAAFVAASSTTVVAALDDVYPFSRYAMYSVASVSPHYTDRVTFIGLYRDGTSRELTSGSSRQVLLRLGSWDRGAVSPALIQTARDLGVRFAADGVEVWRERLVVSQFPKPPGLELVRRKRLYEVRLQ